MSIFRGQRGQRREHYIGNGKYRELATKAAEAEQKKDFESAQSLWAQAFRFIDVNKDSAAITRDFVNNRIHFCQVWGIRYRAMANQNQKVAA